jgi:hypothetical protein
VVAALMFDGLAGWIGKDHAPGSAAVIAAPQGGASGIDSGRLAGIESEGVDTGAQIEHTPG